MEKPESNAIESLGLLALEQYRPGHDIVLNPVHLSHGEPYTPIRAACRL